MPQKFEKSLQKTKSNFLSERLMRLNHYAEQKISIWQTGTFSNIKKLGDFFQVNIHVGLNKGV